MAQSPCHTLSRHVIHSSFPLFNFIFDVWFSYLIYQENNIVLLLAESKFKN
ncbi:hypothetical protein YC2023_000768 [Brassica napus]